MSAISVKRLKEEKGDDIVGTVVVPYHEYQTYVIVGITQRGAEIVLLSDFRDLSLPIVVIADRDLVSVPNREDSILGFRWRWDQIAAVYPAINRRRR